MNNDAVTLEVGQKAPDFEAEITNGEKIKLSDVLSSGEKVILYFYPKDSTPVVLFRPVILGIITLYFKMQDSKSLVFRKIPQSLIRNL